MSANTILVCLVIFNLLTMNYAYRIESNDEPTQALFRTIEDNENNNQIVPCHAISYSSYILCKKLDHLSRRDTGFLRFGRKR